MDNKRRTYYVDWWQIKKSSVYGLIALLIFLCLAGGGFWWMIRSNWFSSSEIPEGPKDSAWMISWEGDVRITRAATRETEKVAKDTYLLSGDTIQTQAD